MELRRFVLRWMVLPSRLRLAIAYLYGRLTLVIRWLFNSREHTNLTYNLTELNVRYLAKFLCVICNQPAHVIEGYLREVLNDEQLRSHIIRSTRESMRNFLADDEPRYACRIGWYAIVRATRPSVVVETGADKGLGSCLIAAALMRNNSEEVAGKYFGTDILTLRPTIYSRHHMISLGRFFMVTLLTR